MIHIYLQHSFTCCDRCLLRQVYPPAHTHTNWFGYQWTRARAHKRRSAHAHTTKPAVPYRY